MRQVLVCAFDRWFSIFILAVVVIALAEQSIEAGLFAEQNGEHLSIPTKLSATAVSATQINLSWHKSEDSKEDSKNDKSDKGEGENKDKDKDKDNNDGVLGYRIFRNGSQIAQVTGTSYSDMHLAPKTTYTYAVAAYDASGNVSRLSSSISATTFADTTPPSIPTGLT